MTTEIATMLDELMGKNRNAAPDDQKNDMHWSDKDVCKHFLCGFCPAELFTNTRSDLGPCEKVHDESLRKAYLKSTRYLKMSYESDFLHYLQQCMQDVERRIRRNHQRLQLSEEKNQKLANPSKDVEEQINLLTQRIEEMLQRIELLGTEGKVEEAQGVMKLCDQLKEDREQLYGQKGNVLDAFSVQEKQMEVCEVCGAFLIVGDAQSRVDDHLMGKQHMGYAKIKATIEELKEKLMSRPVEKDIKEEATEKKYIRNRTDEARKSRDGRDGGRHSKSKDDKGSDRIRHRTRSRERDGKPRNDDRRDRDRRRSRDKERRRSKDRRHSRDNDGHRSRDRDRSRRDRSRDRDSRRSGDSKSKDDRSKRSRSRDKDRKRSRRHSRPRSRTPEKNPKRSRKSDQHEGEGGSSTEDKKEDKPAPTEQPTKDEVTDSNEQIEVQQNEEPKETQVTEKENEIQPTSDGNETKIQPTSDGNEMNDSSETQPQETDEIGPPGEDGSTNNSDIA